MQGNTQESLNSTGECRVITIDELEQCFVEPFENPESRKKRSELCDGFREWLLEVKRFEVPIDIWINGLFATYEAMPDYVNMICIEHYNEKHLYGKDYINFDFFTRENNVYIRQKYKCSIELPLLNYNLLKDYDEYFFGEFQHYKHGGVCEGIFRISLHGP